MFGLCALAPATVSPNASPDDHLFASVALVWSGLWIQTMGFDKFKADFSHSPLSSVNSVITLEDSTLRNISKVYHTLESPSLRLEDITRLLLNLLLPYRS